MARKLFCMVALIGLVSLAQAAPMLAEAYSLSNLGDEFNWTWTETRIENSIPGSAGGSFTAWSNTAPLGQDWNIALLANDPASPGDYILNGGWVTIAIVYRTLDPGNPPGTPFFFSQNYGGPPISSSDTMIRTIATYKADPITGLPLYENGYSLLNQTMTLEGSGHNSDGTPFTFAATLKEVYGDHAHYGYLENFQLIYPSSSVPVPGAIWLLGTGLVGLACLGWRRKK